MRIWEEVKYHPEAYEDKKTVICFECGGNGELDNGQHTYPCGSCNGLGMLQRTEKVTYAQVKD